MSIDQVTITIGGHELPDGSDSHDDVEIAAVVGVDYQPREEHCPEQFDAHLRRIKKVESTIGGRHEIPYRGGLADRVEAWMDENPDTVRERCAEQRQKPERVV